MDVVIGGVNYVPFGLSHSKIGIAITTHNRPDVLIPAIEQHMKYLPAGAALFIIDDGSNPPVMADDRFEIIRNDVSQGIVSSKNSSITVLIDAGCDHLFLWDDDAWPIADNWHLPYIESPEPHLSYQFLDLAGRNKLNDMAILYSDNKHVAYTGQRGVMLYYHRSAIEKVGGFDPVYGRGMYEHSDLALRIHNAGMTTWAYADVAGSENLIYSLDEHEAVDRSVSKSERNALVEKNVKIHNERRDIGFTGYVEYRKMKNAVITCLLTSQPDPQRGKIISPDPDLLKAWSESIQDAEAVVLADQLTTPPGMAKLVSVPEVNMNIYFRRWLHIYQFLRDNPQYEFVWCTDGSDVEMLSSPWSGMESGKIYVGSEPKTYDDAWAIKNHPERMYQDFIKKYRNDMMLNAGLLGGTRADVMDFAHGIVRLYYRIESYRYWKKEQSASAVGDMIAFGIVAKSFGERIVTGPRINTVFKTNGIGRESAWWKHK